MAAMWRYLGYRLFDANDLISQQNALVLIL